MLPRENSLRSSWSGMRELVSEEKVPGRPAPPPRPRAGTRARRPARRSARGRSRACGSTSPDGLGRVVHGGRPRRGCTGHRTAFTGLAGICGPPAVLSVCARGCRSDRPADRQCRPGMRPAHLANRGSVVGQSRWRTGPKSSAIPAERRPRRCRPLGTRPAGPGDPLQLPRRHPDRSCGAVDDRRPGRRPLVSVGWAFGQPPALVGEPRQVLLVGLDLAVDEQPQHRQLIIDSHRTPARVRRGTARPTRPSGRLDPVGLAAVAPLRCRRPAASSGGIPVFRAEQTRFEPLLARCPTRTHAMREPHQ